MDLSYQLFIDIFANKEIKNESYDDSSFSLNILKYSDWPEIYYSYYFDKISNQQLINKWLTKYGYRIIESQYKNIINSLPQFYNPLYWISLKVTNDLKNDIKFEELKSLDKEIVKEWFIKSFKQYSNEQILEFCKKHNIKSDFNFKWLIEDNINTAYLEKINNLNSSILSNNKFDSDDNKIILCKIDYYDKYNGTEKPQKEYKGLRALQYERTSFLNIDGYCMGYVQLGNGSQRFNSKYINRKMTIVFIAKNNEDGLWYVVGYYDDAKVYDQAHAYRLSNGETIIYNCRTQFQNAFLIPKESRIPINHKDIPGKIKSSNVNYLEEDSSLRDWTINLYNDLQNYNLQNNRLNERDEELYQSQANDCSINKIPKTQNITSNNYVRDPIIAGRAILLSNYKCELDSSHFSFIDKNGKMYLEAHHLVPMQLQKEKPDVSLDIVDNIVALCPNCHRAIHKSSDNYKMIEELYNRRKDKLRQKGIDFSLEDLLKSKCY